MRILVSFALSTFIATTVLAAELNTKTQRTSTSLDEDFEDNFEEISSSEFSLGFNLGQRNFNGGIGRLAQSGIIFGLTALYDFNELFATEFSYTESNHSIDPSVLSTTGNIGASAFSVKGRYYPQINRLPYNISPYLSAGISSNKLTMNIANQTSTAQRYDIGLEAGIGSKFLFANDRAFFDIQLAYKQIDYEGYELLDQNLSPTGINFEGNEINLISALTFIL